VIWTHAKKKENSFITGLYRSLRVPRRTVIDMSVKGLPLLFNEAFWSLGVTMMAQCFSTRGLDVVAATSIALTILNLFNVVYISLGVSVSIVVGKKLGAGLLAEARDTARKMIAFSGTVTAGISVITIALAGVFPMLYNTENSVRELATYMIIVSALVMPFCAFAQASYFTIRSGGKVLITIIFDSAFMWVVVVPVCYVLSRFTDIGIHLLYAICQSLEILKMAFGFFLLVKVDWVKKIVKKTDAESLAPSDEGESLKENG
jgi:Na+-driven multidrug efflux pump